LMEQENSGARRRNFSLKQKFAQWRAKAKGRTLCGLLGHPARTPASR
jgi:hypothetical protein